MRELASLGRTRAALGKVGALPHVLLVAVEPALTVAEHGKVAADALARADVDVRERTCRARAAALVEEVQTERGAFRRGVVGEVARLGGVGAVALQKVPADGDLGGVVLIQAGEAAAAGT